MGCPAADAHPALAAALSGPRRGSPPTGMLTYPDLAAFTHTLNEGGPPPEVVIWPAPTDHTDHTDQADQADQVGGGSVLADVHAVSARALRFLREVAR